MSVPTFLQSVSVPFAIGTDGISYKNAVCKKTWGLSITPTLVEEETDCGVATSTGAKKFQFSLELVLNTTPNGATELSANELANWANSGTLVYVMLTDSAGYLRSGSGYISNYTEAAPQGGVVGATMTVSGNGTLDVTP